jgi:predicted transcriptional regulator
MGALPETPKFTFRLPEELKNELREVADAEGRTLTNLMVYFLREHLAEYRRRQARPGPNKSS